MAAIVFLLQKRFEQLILSAKLLQRPPDAVADLILVQNELGEFALSRRVHGPSCELSQTNVDQVVVNYPLTWTLIAKTYNGSCISNRQNINLQAVGDLPFVFNVEQAAEEGKYYITIRASVPGALEVSILVNNETGPKTAPISVLPPRQYDDIGKHVSSMTIDVTLLGLHRQFSAPPGLVVTRDGLLAVAMPAQGYVLLVNQNGDLINTLRADMMLDGSPFFVPSVIAQVARDESIWIGDNSSRRLLVFSKDGQLERQVVLRRAVHRLVSLDENTFVAIMSDPHMRTNLTVITLFGNELHTVPGVSGGVCVLPSTNMVVVCDSTSCCLLFFNKQLQLLFSIDKRGELNHPFDIAVTAQEDFVILDFDELSIQSGNRPKRVSAWTKKGQFIGAVDSLGQNLSAIAVLPNGLVAVSQRQSSIIQLL